MNGEGCLGCFISTIILIVLISIGPIGWIILVILGIIGAISNNSQSSSPTSSPPEPKVIIPDDINNILMDLSQGEIKDMISQETFKPGEKVYFCSVHRLAYHEDSWQYIEHKCPVCSHGNNIKVYTVPTPVNLPEIQWEDLN